MKLDGWSLDPQLARDTILLGDLPLSQLLVAKDANYPWLVLVPRRKGTVEIIDLDQAEQAELLAEIGGVSRALRDVTQCDKLNVAALGNVVAQLHVHIIARRKTDAAWPRPVWGVAEAKKYDAAAMEAFMTAIRKALWNA